MPLLSEHSNNITLNEKLFARVKEVYNQKKTYSSIRKKVSCWKMPITASSVTVLIWKEKHVKNTVG